MNTERVDRRIQRTRQLLNSALMTLIVEQGYDSITEKDLKGHLRFLASDEMRGRETAQPESRITAVYVASRFEQLGLKPIGDDNTYMQNFKIRRAGVDPEASSLSLYLNNEIAKEYTFGDDFIIQSGIIKEPLPVVLAQLKLDN